jgi:hypothetical protein
MYPPVACPAVISTHLPMQFAALSSHWLVAASAGELRSTPVPMRVIAKKRYRVMVEPLEKDAERGAYPVQHRIARGPRRRPRRSWAHISTCHASTSPGWRSKASSSGGLRLENANHLALNNKTSCWGSRNDGLRGISWPGHEIPNAAKRGGSLGGVRSLASQVKASIDPIHDHQV